MSHGWHCRVLWNQGDKGLFGLPLFQMRRDTERLSSRAQRYRTISAGEGGYCCDAGLYALVCVCVIASVKEIPIGTCSASVLAVSVGCVPMKQCSFVEPRNSMFCSKMDFCII